MSVLHIDTAWPHYTKHISMKTEQQCYIMHVTHSMLHTDYPVWQCSTHISHIACSIACCCCSCCCWLFPCVQGFWENVWQFIPRLHGFCLGFFFFLIVEISLHTVIPLFRPGSVHSGSMSWDDCVWVFPDKLRVNSFPDRFPHYAWLAALSAHSDFIGSRVYVCLGVTCHLHFWQND